MISWFSAGNRVNFSSTRSSVMASRPVEALPKPSRRQPTAIDVPSDEEQREIDEADADFEASRTVSHEEMTARIRRRASEVVGTRKS
jgi:hypothetical protein